MTFEFEHNRINILRRRAGRKKERERKRRDGRKEGKKKGKKGETGRKGSEKENQNS